MDVTYVTVAISDLAKSKDSFEATFLVDTGHRLHGTWNKLRQAGIEPEWKAEQIICSLIATRTRHQRSSKE